MQKHLVFSLGLCLAAASAGAQDKNAVDKAIRDPARKEQSGKADVYIQDKTRISDTPPSSGKKTSTAKARKKGSCGSHIRHKKGPAR